MSGRRTFLANIRRALGHDPETVRNDEALFEVTSTATSPTPADRDIIERLAATGAAIQAPVSVVADPAAAGDAIAKLAIESRPEWGTEKTIVCWDAPLVQALKLDTRLTNEQITLHHCGTHRSEADSDNARARMRQLIAGAYIGITSVRWCLADSATLVMPTGVGRPRAVSLLPSIHIAVIHKGQIIANLGDLYRRLDADDGPDRDAIGHSLTLITGPSKTADIEATMVHGAHGPRALHIFVVADVKDRS